VWQRFLAIYVILSAAENLLFFRTTTRFFATLRMTESATKFCHTQGDGPFDNMPRRGVELGNGAN
jgi:hypothetical protein